MPVLQWLSGIHAGGGGNNPLEKCCASSIIILKVELKVTYIEIEMT